MYSGFSRKSQKRVADKDENSTKMCTYPSEISEICLFNFVQYQNVIINEFLIKNISSFIYVYVLF